MIFFIVVNLVELSDAKGGGRGGGGRGGGGRGRSSSSRSYGRSRSYSRGGGSYRYQGESSSSGYYDGGFRGKYLIISQYVERIRNKIAETFQQNLCRMKDHASNVQNTRK